MVHENKGMQSMIKHRMGGNHPTGMARDTRTSASVWPRADKKSTKINENQ